MLQGPRANRNEKVATQGFGARHPFGWTVRYFFLVKNFDDSVAREHKIGKRRKDDRLHGPRAPLDVATGDPDDPEIVRLDRDGGRGCGHGDRLFRALLSDALGPSQGTTPLHRLLRDLSDPLDACLNTCMSKRTHGSSHIEDPWAARKPTKRKQENKRENCIDRFFSQRLCTREANVVC